MVQVIGGLGVGLLVATLLVAWRLASGPVSISFLTPYIEGALAEVHKGSVKLAVDDTILTWAGWERTLDIRIVNLRTSLPNGEEIATVPEVSISLSAEALLKGAVAPRSVEFFGPRFRVVRDADGSFALGIQGTKESSNDFVASMILLMLQEPDPKQAMSFLKRISIVAGEITYEDRTLGTTWYAPNANAQFIRAAGGLNAELDLDLQAGDKLAAVSIQGSYLLAGKRIDLGVSFDKLTPADFVSLSPKMDVFGAVDVPLSGTITLSMEQNGRVEGVGFDLSGGPGAVALPVPLAAKLDALAWAQRMAVGELHINGRYEGGTGAIDIAELDVVFKDGETFYLPTPIDHEMPLKSISSALSYSRQAGRVVIKDMQIGLGGGHAGATAGPVATLTATIDGLTADGAGVMGTGLAVDITGSIADVAFNDLPSYWPEQLGVDARTWVIPNLRDGVADRASISLALRPGRDDALTLASMAGEIHAHGLSVDYLAPMPPVRNAVGSATFNEKRFDIKVEEADGYKGLKIMGGDIALFNLQHDLPEADISMDVLGPVPAALELIDHQPLGFASDLGIKPKNADGTVAAHVRLQFPLKADLLAAEVVAEAQARLSAASIKGALFDKDLVKGDLDLAVTNDGLELKGDASLGNVPVQLVWNHDFRDGALFRDRYELSGTIKDVLNLSALGIEVPGILSRYLSGGAEANVNYTELADGRQSMSARIDLANISLAAPELGWSKPKGVPGTAVLEFRLKDGAPQEIPKFEVSAPDMDIAGSATFFPDGTLERIDLNTMRSGSTDVSASLTPAPGNTWELVLRGESLDASLLWDEILGIRDVPARQNIDDDDLLVSVAVDIHTLMIRKDRVLTDLIGTVYREQGGWRKIDVTGVVSGAKGGGSIEFMLDTDTDGLRYLSITSDNAGAALRTLDLYDNILGGTLDMKAAYTNPRPDAPLEGVLKVEDYAMRDAPAFAELIGIMSLTGVLDALQGEGLNFDIFDAPFKLDNGVLTLSESRASGPTIGVTASGTVDMDNKLMDIKGTVVPAYVINALLGKIPIIGELFTGPEKGGGLFAATYTMKGVGENVEITVNPLSALAPGLLRGIFTGSDKEKEIPEKAAPQTVPAPQEPQKSQEPLTPPSPKAAPRATVTPAPVQ
ncbi:AsmA-like C-terminal region-containing protein [Magnetovibrio sp.]|uniref:YhdP family protein n=1 Tax=Magnetovibrio sp. TaxID=2024836 RepID=UPI002F951A30